MPILGFIGTVLGISTGVGEFASFLTEEIADIENIKQQLSQVASGLAFAFGTTFLGLITSLATMWFCSMVQNREEQFLTDLERLCLEIIETCGHVMSAGAEVAAQTSEQLAEPFTENEVHRKRLQDMEARQERLERIVEVLSGPFELRLAPRKEQTKKQRPTNRLLD